VKNPILLSYQRDKSAKEFLELISGLSLEKFDHWAVSNSTIADLGSGSVVVVLGHSVRKFLDLPEMSLILPYTDMNGVMWRFLPYPSGRTQTYNDPIFRAAVRLMLQELT